MMAEIQTVIDFGIIIIVAVITITSVVFGLLLLVKGSLIISRKQYVGGREARIIGAILLLGGVLSPFTYGLAGLFSILISIIFGWVTYSRKGRRTSDPADRKPIRVAGEFIVEPSPVESPLDTAEHRRAGIVPSKRTSAGELPAEQPLRREPLPDTWRPDVGVLPPKDIPGRLSVPETQTPAQDIESRHQPKQFEPIPLASLEVIKGSLSKPVIPIHSTNFLIGRDRDADLQLLDEHVSREHARLRFAGGKWFIQDQNTENGTIVNGEAITAARIKSGDRITIMSFTFIFRNNKKSEPRSSLCPNCQQEIQASWITCPICHTSLKPVEQKKKPEAPGVAKVESQNLPAVNQTAEPIKSKIIPEKTLDETKERKRSGCLTAWLVLAIIANSIIAFLSWFLAANTPYAAGDYGTLLVLGGFLNLTCVGFAIAILKWKKWGVYGFACCILATIILSLSQGNALIALQGLLPLGILILLIRPYWDQMD